MIIILPDEDDRDLITTPEQTPDVIIHSLRDLLEIFPPRN
jgi:hypothetical protein